MLIDLYLILYIIFIPQIVNEKQKIVMIAW